jgi:hypothetical protein
VYSRNYTSRQKVRDAASPMPLAQLTNFFENWAVKSKL